MNTIHTVGERFHSVNEIAISHPIFGLAQDGL